jgi:hypothetical protein
VILCDVGDALRKFVYHQRNVANAVENTAKVMQTDITQFIETSQDAKKEELAVRTSIFDILGTLGAQFF